ncbi:MAG: glycoside-pentoside-hexuronide (GPH):cation symporter [Clostridiales bacterium]|nr:glycoside-pentoside-hexuronide (GPH):cation symporter [Clostridiales bacterium]
MNQNETGRISTDIKLGFGKQLGFSMGEMGGQFFFAFWGSYLSVFYTDIVGLAPFVVSIIFMAARVWDAINDPIMGNIADRHRHKKYGRYRPWILFGAPVLGIVSILVWHVPNASSTELKIIYCTVTYILAGMLYTLVNVPYMSLQSTLTTNNKSRGDLANLKGAFTFVGSAAMNLFTMTLITKLGGGEANAKGYFLTGVVFTIVGLILFFITFATTKEVYFAEPQETKATFKELVSYIFGNRAVLAIMFSLLCSMLCTFGRLGVAVYYYMYCCQAYAIVGVLMVVPTACAIIPTYVVPKIPIARKPLIIIAFIGRAAALFALYLIDFTNITAIIVCLVFVGVFNYETGMLSGLIAPAIDDCEVRKGIRLDGTIYAMVNLFAKLATAVGGSVGLAIMGAMGYVANAEQTSRALTGINIATNILPAIFCAAGVIPILFYNLNNEKMEENSRILAERHAVSENSQQ